MLSIVIPAHNEAAYLGACLRSVALAAGHEQLAGEEVRVIVVADSCRDATETIARKAGAQVVRVWRRNVGRARAVGCRLALAQGARWLAFTDADSVVAPDWLVRQLALGCDAVCGTVEVADWSAFGDEIRRDFDTTYQDRDGHRHIHGANLGVSAEAYQRAGGFAPLRSSEDVALVHALEAAGARIAWSAAPRVATSARRDARAPEGFGAALLRVEAQMLAPLCSAGAALQGAS
jgi:glycosyltransferase involved in cell wall biosynthesis